MMEVLVALLIIAILAVGAVPLYQHYLTESRITGASEGLYHALILAKSESLKQQANIRVVLQTGSGWCYGITTATTCDCQAAAACNLGQASSADFSGSSLGLSGITTYVQFESVRGEATPTGTMTFSSGSSSVVVSVNQVGRARICSDSIGGFVAC